MKGRVTVAAIAVLCAVLAISGIWTLRKNRTPPHDKNFSSRPREPAAAPQMPSARIPTSPMEQKSDGEKTIASATPALSLTKKDEVQQHRAADADPHLLGVKQMLRDYRSALGENPVGTNAEITKALLGANSKKARFVTTEARLNRAQQLLDRWDHPYFFHQVSRTRMEIRSAGPDGVMWNADDELSR